jgi:hypothetical protein
MAYYQDVVVEYLRENRAIFTNTECCIQLNKGNPDISGPHWYCDALAVDLDAKAVYLCEVTYARRVGALLNRLMQWNAHWPSIQTSLVRDNKVSPDWSVTPWLFMPEAFIDGARLKIKKLTSVPGETSLMPFPRITSLESIVPWNPARHTKIGKEVSITDAGSM